MLLDTNAFIWFLDGDKSLSAPALKAIEDIQNPVYISIACLWEIAIKRSLQKLDFTPTFQQIYDDIDRMGAVLLPIKQTHLEYLETLPFHHRDPFDRLMIAQAETEGMTVITKDDAFALYGLQTLW